LGSATSTDIHRHSTSGNERLRNRQNLTTTTTTRSHIRYTINAATTTSTHKQQLNKASPRKRNRTVTRKPIDVSY
jgi:hypothetical protein